VEDALWATQVLHHYLHPNKSKKDGRHDFADFLSSYKSGDHEEDSPNDQGALRFTHEGLEYQYGDERGASERTGVSHLVHAWQMQGHQGQEVRTLFY
jgi:hypothetical protein